MTTITAPAYGVTATLDGDVLTLEGKNKAARMALAGPAHGDGPVVLRRAEIAEVTLKSASALVNGNLILNTADGRRFQVHFRKKQADDVTRLAEALRSA